MTDYPPGDTPEAERLPEIVAKIDDRFGKMLRYNHGWDGIVAGVDMLLEAVHPGIVYQQIKEKLGGLRIYIDTAGWPAEETNRAGQIIAEAEAAANSICEDCGAPGKPTSVGGWLAVLCDICKAARERAREERIAAFRRASN